MILLNNQLLWSILSVKTWSGNNGFHGLLYSGGGKTGSHSFGLPQAKIKKEEKKSFGTGITVTWHSELAQICHNVVAPHLYPLPRSLWPCCGSQLGVSASTAGKKIERPPEEMLFLVSMVNAEACKAQCRQFWDQF